MNMSRSCCSSVETDTPYTPPNHPAMFIIFFPFSLAPFFKQGDGKCPLELLIVSARSAGGCAELSLTNDKSFLSAERHVLHSLSHCTFTPHSKSLSS